MNAALLICEMFAYYASQSVSLLERLEALYTEYGYYLNTQHSFTFDGSTGLAKMREIMRRFRGGIRQMGGKQVLECLDYSEGLNDLPKSDVLKFILEDHCSVVVRPSGTEPKLKFYIAVSAESQEDANRLEKRIAGELESYLR